MADKSVMKALDKIRKSHVAAMTALDRWHRSGSGTATARKNYERYERMSEEFDTQMVALMGLLSNDRKGAE
jgi:hypothetical protein